MKGKGGREEEGEGGTEMWKGRGKGDKNAERLLEIRGKGKIVFPKAVK